LFVQLRGRKRFRLVPPYEMFNVYPSAGVWSANRHCAADDPEFALSGQMEVCEVVVDPGEALLIPAGWWHHVLSLDVSISMSFTNFYWPNYFGYPLDKKRWSDLPGVPPAESSEPETAELAEAAT
jgi:ribosomal protein L16 Arg81 hydroxylase